MGLLLPDVIVVAVTTEVFAVFPLALLPLLAYLVLNEVTEVGVVSVSE